MAYNGKRPYQYPERMLGVRPPVSAGEAFGYERDAHARAGVPHPWDVNRARGRDFTR